jgi:FOG: PKD repeat
MFRPMKKLLIFSLLFPACFATLWAQPYDFMRSMQWPVGYKDSTVKTVINLLDFRTEPPTVTPFKVSDGAIPLGSVAAVCDTAGELLLYTNGCSVLDGKAQPIANGHHITPDDWVYNIYCPDYYPTTDSWLMLTDPASDSLFYLMAIGHRQNTGDGIKAWGLYASHLSANGVLEKNTLVCEDFIFGGHLSACRHANGRDWWVVINKINTNRYYKYLLDPGGFQFVDLQAIGLPTTWEGSGSGQSAFSSDGKIFIHYDNVTDMYVYDFDRCSGELGNFRKVNILYNEDTNNSFGGMAISPNSRFAYTFGNRYAFQVDLWSQDLQASVTQVAYWDGTYVSLWKTTFGKAALAPNGKIYAAVPGGSIYLHVVHNPDAKGDSCRFAQHDLYLPYSWNTEALANFPNYRLGPLDGSPCDTLEIDNRPVAWWRSEQDTLDPLRAAFTDLSAYGPTEWHWDFGDPASGLNNMSTERHPEHLFSEPGAYEVCLRVSNANAEHTLCRTLQLGSALAKDPAVQDRVLLAPNPFGDWLSVSLSAVVRSPVLILYDQLGREVLRQSLSFGVTEIGTGHLPAGIYFYRVEARGEMVKSGKLVKTGAR